MIEALRAPSDRTEFYREFIEFVRADLQKERRAVNRRMIGVFAWCFLIPAVLSLGAIFLSKLGLLPKPWSRHLDWIMVFCPLAYALYVLAFDLLRDVPVVIRRGGMASALGRALSEEQWRAQTCESMRIEFLTRRAYQAPVTWLWLVRNFRIDLNNMQARTRYLTALAGAVFFLLMQGIDSIDDPGPNLTWHPASLLSWVEASSNNIAQFVGLGFFLVLFYLSGSQVHTALVRYLHCAELILVDLDPNTLRRKDD